MVKERFMNFSRLVDDLQKNIRRLKTVNAAEFGLKSVHVFWIYSLSLHPEGMTAASLAAESMIDRSLISREISELKNHGYITSSEPGGKRSYRATIHLTEKGRELADILAKRAFSIQDTADEGVSEEELVIMYKALKKIARNLEKSANYVKNTEKQHKI